MPGAAPTLSCEFNPGVLQLRGRLLESFEPRRQLKLPLLSGLPALVNDFLNPRRFDAALIGWELSGDPDPYPLWHSTQAVGGGQNYSGWANEEATWQ